MEEKKINNPSIAELGKNTRFSSENQPTPEQKSMGHQKRRKREELKLDMFNELFNKALPNGSDALEEGMKLLRNAVFASGKDTKMSYKDRVKLFMDIVPVR